MKKSNDSTSPFEKQLMASAGRLRAQQDYQLPLRKSPRHRRPSTTWVASIAAACLGWVVGISFPIEKEQPEADLALYAQPDTVIQYKERLVHDTVIQKVETPVKSKVVPAKKKPTEYYADVQGCNVECDGIDYAMLIGM